MDAISTAECQNCGKRLRGVSGTRLVCPVCNTMNRLPPAESEPKPTEPTGGWKRVDDETPIRVRRSE